MKAVFGSLLLAALPVYAISDTSIYYGLGVAAAQEYTSSVSDEWQDDFFQKMVLEDDYMALAQSIEISTLGDTGYSAAYWQGFVDWFFEEIEIMNDAPGTGGPVPGTALKYVVPYATVHRIPVRQNSRGMAR